MAIVYVVLFSSMFLLPPKAFANPDSFLERIPMKVVDVHRIAMPALRAGVQIHKNPYLVMAVSSEDTTDAKSQFAKDDLPQDLLMASGSVEDIVVDLDQIDKRGLNSGQVETQPWSDDFWPTYKGILGFRYADPNMSKIRGGWKKYHKFVIDNSFQKYLNDKKIAILSPSEKYDLLIGNFPSLKSAYQPTTVDGNTYPKSLTAMMWEEGKSYLNRNPNRDGVIEPWMGICHGQAPASYMLPRPLHPIVVKSVNGFFEITFYPADLKALGSLFWANLSFNKFSIGGRCGLKKKEITKDEISGRILNPECFDTNPGSWHIVLVNQVGVRKKSFIMDATFDYEVWNHPLVSYKYNYFNPQTLVTYQTAREATIAMKDYKRDKFKKFRSPKSKFIVGVSMTVSYIAGTTPAQLKYDDTSLDEINTLYYTYDLELNDSGQIIGGEWYSNRHPDFLWTPDEETAMLSSFDQQISSDWEIQKQIPQLPEDWAHIAQLAAGQKMPLGKILDVLWYLSRR